MDEGALIDEIYECAFVPELWRSVLRRLGSLANTRASWTFVVNDDAVGSSEIARLREEALTLRREVGARGPCQGNVPRAQASDKLSRQRRSMPRERATPPMRPSVSACRLPG